MSETAGVAGAREGSDPEDPSDQLRTAVAEEPDRLDGMVPEEEGPRRRVLLILAAAAFSLLLWSLFRSGPSSLDSARPDRSRDALVENMANEADPSWMRSPDTMRTPIPPMYGPAGAAALENPPGVDPDVAPLPGDSSGINEGTQSADPRREAFQSALRSKPALGTFTPAPSASDEPTGAAAPQPSLLEMELQAHAEADRRSAAPTGPGFALSADPSALGLAAETGAGPGRVSRSSYVSGGTEPAPEVAPPQMMAPRGAGTANGWVVPIGTIIEGQLHTAVVSDLPGSVLGMVTRHVFDATQRHVVIPRFSWLLGTYESDVATGQARLVVLWTAVRFPSGETYALPGLRAGDRSGASGLRGSVNNHYGRVFGHAMLSSVLAAGFQLAEADGEDRRSARDAAAAATAQQLGQTASEVTRRNLNIKPTITVPRLTQFAIILDRELVFTPSTRRP